MTRKITIALLLTAVAVLGIWDFVVAMNDTQNDTISEVILGVAFHNPIVPFITGVGIGHLFWPQRT